MQIEEEDYSLGSGKIISIFVFDFY